MYRYGIICFLVEKLSSIFVEEGELHLKDIIVSCIIDQNLKVKF